MLHTVSISHATAFLAHISEACRRARMRTPRPGAAAPRGRSAMVRTPGANVGAMSERRFFDDLSERINEALRNSPAQDIEKNLRALLASWFDRMDLVMREDFEVQKKLLEAALARVAALEARLAELERRSGGDAAR
jgi:BMFP domain-containing protein YqiC